jgi:signal transduction histidine kinase
MLRIRPTQVALYAAGAGILLFTPFAAFASLQVASWQVVWGAVTSLGAWLLGRSPPQRAQRIMVALGASVPALYCPILLLSGGASSPAFAWLIALPMGLVVVFRAHERAVVAGAISALAAAVLVCLSGNLPALIFALRVMQVAVASGLAIAGSRAFAVSARREAQAMKEREAAQAELAATWLLRERAERTLYLVRLSRALAHEVNNPLGFLKSNIEFLINNIQNAEDHEALEDALAGVNRIRDVVEELKVIAGEKAIPNPLKGLTPPAPRRVIVELPKF